MSGLFKRRSFLQAAVAVSAAPSLFPHLAHTAASDSGKIKLGFDNFSIRNLGWKASQILQYAAGLKVDVVFFSDLDVYESLEEDYLKKLKNQADELGLEIYAGTGGACPTSSRFINKYGSAEDHLALTIRVAKTLGSPVARCYTGVGQDREEGSGYARHIEAMIQVCKSVRNRALDAGVKIGIENHAGDMQAWELAMLIEEAGKDYVGATMDPGNSVWIVEDPMLTLEILGPYAVATGIRDDAVWESENGAWTEWTNIGDGHIDWKAYLERYKQLCPNVPFMLEIISGARREMPYLKPDFWKVYPQAKASEFARFVGMAKHGKEPKVPEERPTGQRSNELTQQQQKFDLEKSLRYCQESLGLGQKA